MASRKLRPARSLGILLGVLLGLTGLPAMADGNPEAGKAQAAPCGACHGQDGATGLDPTYPNLAGQNQKYLVRQLKAIRDGGRDVALMAGQLNGKSDQDLADLAAYFSSLPEKTRQAQGDDEQLEKARKIYKGGIADRQVAACTACHAPSGNGNDEAGFPSIGGQPTGYVINQLTAYREGDRTTDEVYGGMMRGVARGLTDKEIATLADFIQGLY